MQRLSALSILITTMAVVPAQAQLDRMGGSAGDVRTPDRPISAPPLRSPEAAGFLSDSMKFLGGIGPKSPDEVLKNLDKELGQTSRVTAEPDLGGPGPIHKPGEELEKRPAAPTTFK
jgi:hypothetical protein